MKNILVKIAIIYLTFLYLYPIHAMLFCEFYDAQTTEQNIVVTEPKTPTLTISSHETSILESRKPIVFEIAQKYRSSMQQKVLDFACASTAKTQQCIMFTQQQSSDVVQHMKTWSNIRIGLTLATLLDARNFFKEVKNHRITLAQLKKISQDYSFVFTIPLLGYIFDTIIINFSSFSTNYQISSIPLSHQRQALQAEIANIYQYDVFLRILALPSRTYAISHAESLLSKKIKKAIIAHATSCKNKRKAAFYFLYTLHNFQSTDTLANNALYEALKELGCEEDV